ncbi:MAG: YiiX/YebB-like N1pC/P60 family cysteine hydrolase, partial [Campylobacterota bacterium]
QAYSIRYAAFLTQYRYAMEYIALMENDPGMHTMLNETVPELGLQKDRYKALKFRFLNVITGIEFARLDALYRLRAKGAPSALAVGIEEDSRAIWKKGSGEGPKATANNAVKIAQDTGFNVFFPVQKEVSEWMGDVKILRVKRSLINKDQIEEIKSLLQPGDILLERREWYLSNVGLPGYWPHAALYIGTPQERTAYFKDSSIAERYAEHDGNFDAYLKQRFAKAYQNSLLPQEYGRTPRVIEAISEGVSFTTVEHSVSADSVVILRPRLSKADIALAIERAFHYSGRPYDFNFDFLTDSSLVCTELVYKAYEPKQDYAGLTFPLQEIVGRKVSTANDMAQMFDEQYGKSNQQLDFIAFYDGHEWQNRAIKSNLKTFRESWKRSKWFIWVQKNP